MSEANFLVDILRALPPKPSDSAKQSEKKRYSELLSQRIALGLADELRRRGLVEARPVSSDPSGSGAERRMAGGIGAKKVDVTWATEESGLLFAISIKSINFKDSGTNNLQKNLTNRRGDMLFEAVTLHRRFPYAVVVGFFFLSHEACLDATERRKSTFLNAHQRLKLFTGRNDPSGRDEQLERLYIVLLNPDPLSSGVEIFLAGNPETPISLNGAILEWMGLLVDRNPDFYEIVDGKLKKLRQ
ncbi:MAG TPA: hypothetical protein VJ725_14710 [Thermoanaerobaculia bacterium]|nr:hypothetical protein [Thermoanaerobaculia bacterium]